jgi:hypothetical protein
MAGLSKKLLREPVAPLGGLQVTQVVLPSYIHIFGNYIGAALHVRLKFLSIGANTCNIWKQSF